MLILPTTSDYRFSVLFCFAGSINEQINSSMAQKLLNTSKLTAVTGSE